MDKTELNRRFDHHAPDPARAEKHDFVRGLLKSVAADLDRTLPEGREKAVTLTKLEEAMFWANASLARESK